MKTLSANSLSNTERQQAICDRLEAEKRLSVAQICEHFQISAATARRDLEMLADQGHIQRVHGGAIRLQKAPPERPLLERSTVQADEKQRIGRLAAERITDGETVFLGSGSTVHEVAKNLHHKKDLTVITNSLLVINELADAENITIVNTGGMFRRSERSFIGHITDQALAELRADMVIMGIRAISLEQGLTNDYLPETMTDRAIMMMGKELIIVADHTKCARVSTVFLASLDDMHTLITTQAAPDEFVRSLKEKGIQVLLA